MRAADALMYEAKTAGRDRHPLAWMSSCCLLGVLVPGSGLERVITDLLARAQTEIGLGWQQGRWSVAMEHHASAITESASQAVDYAMSAPGRSARGRAAASSLHAARANDMWCPGGWQRRSCDCAAPTSPSSDRRFRPISSPGSSATTRHVRWPSRAPCRCHWSGHGARSALCGSSACPSSAEGEGSGRTVNGASRWEPTTGTRLRLGSRPAAFTGERARAGATRACRGT